MLAPARTMRADDGPCAMERAGRSERQSASQAKRMRNGGALNGDRLPLRGLVARTSGAPNLSAPIDPAPRAAFGWANRRALDVEHLVAAPPLTFARVENAMLAERGRRSRRGDRHARRARSTLRSMPALRSMRREWVALDLPGRVVPRGLTYGRFPVDALPPIESTMDDDLAWLSQQPVAVHSAILSRAEAAAFPERRDARLEGAPVALPRAFATFLSSPDFGARVRSFSGCYVDLADAIVPASDGGWLVHFLSDQQECVHWLLYVGTDGSEAVVAAYAPFGFPERDEDGLDPAWGVTSLRLFVVDDEGPVVCAETFSEFLYRYWIENEICHRAAVGEPFTSEQRRYLDHYDRASGSETR
jgi:hypothetical protein